MFAPAAAVLERHLDDRLVVVLLALVDREAHARHHGGDARVLTSGARKRGKARGAEDEVGRHAVGDGELGRVHRMKRRVTAHAVDERIDDHVHLLDVIGREAVCGAQVVDGVDCGMGGAAGGVRLDGDAPELPVLAEFAQIGIRIARGRREGMVEAAPDLLEDVRRPREAAACEHGAHQAAPGRMARMHALALRAVVHAAPEAGGEGRGKAERILRLLHGKAQDAGCGCGRTERAAGARRVEARAVVRFIGAAGLERTAGDVVADHHRVDELAPRHGTVRKLHRGDGRRHHHGARMVASARVVKLEGMRGRAVDERGVDGRHRLAAAPERGPAGPLAFFAKHGRQALRLNRDGPRNARADGVENVAHGLLHHRVGHGLGGRLHDESGEHLALENIRNSGFSHFRLLS